jgi:hypothetical protein
MLILDADDYFPEGEALRLRHLLRSSTALTLTLRYSIMEGHSPAPTRRVLRNHRGLRFSGIIHETVRGSLPPVSAGLAHTEETDISLQHLGYTNSSLPGKLQRNLPLLQQEWERCQADSDACQGLHIGKELAHTLSQLGQPDAGEQLLTQILTDWPGGELENQFAVEALAALLWRYQETGRAPAAWQLCERVHHRLSGEPAYALYRGLSAFQVQLFAEALTSLASFERHWQAGQIKIPIPLRYTGLALWDLQGQCYLQLGRMDDAAQMFAQCLDAGGDAQEYKTKLHLVRQLSAS